MQSRDRRRFLRQSASAAAALYLPSWLVGCSSRTKSAEEASGEMEATRPDRKIGVALLGLGYYSTDLLAPALQETEHCELRGIITGSPEKIPVWRERYGIEEKNVYNYDNLASIADNDDIDVIYVVTPTSTHARFSIAAAKAGKHVWCEKPMAMTVDECRSIMDACDENNVKLSIGYRMQHEPNTQTVIDWATTQPYGPIERARAEAGFAGSVPTSGWRSRPEMGGGASFDMGVYTINGLRYATGLEPIRVLSANSVIPREVDVTTTYELEFPNGIIASGKTSIVEACNLLRVDCENGWYELSPMQSYNGVEGQASDGTLLNQPIANQQARQMDNDSLAILNDTPVLVPGEEGLKDIRIALAIRAAAASGQPVEIKAD